MVVLVLVEEEVLASNLQLKHAIASDLQKEMVYDSPGGSIYQ